MFGKAEVDAGSTLVNNLRFPGQYYDAETGLHYNWNRYYDPVAGRYTQTDPIGFEGGDVSLYSYVKNDSVNRLDPWGLKNFGDFKYYGNWGGPGYTAGRETSWDLMSQMDREFWMGVYKQGFVKPTEERKKYGYPHDRQDYAYMRHDICYGEARLNNQDCPPSRLRDLFNQCDIDLFNDLISLGFTLHDASFAVHQLGGILVFAIQPGVRNTINQWEYYMNMVSDLHGIITSLALD